MLSVIRNAWKVPDIRKKLLWTLLFVAIYRMGTHIPAAFIDTSALQSMTKSSLLGFYDLLSGGAFSKFSILALGVMPYINASIIMQLLTVAIPSLEQLQKEGQDGRNKIQNATRYVAIVIAIILAIGMIATLASQGVITSTSKVEIGIIVFSLVVGATFSIWIGDQITVRGLGNGTSILIFINIISRLPVQSGSVYSLVKAGTLSAVQLGLFIAGAIIIVILAVYFSLAERRIPVQYTGKVVGNNMQKGQSTHIPLSIISAAVIAIIFAMSVMGFPEAIAQFFPNAQWAIWIQQNPYSPFNKSTWIYPTVYAILTIFFTWFYNEVTLKPDEMAENLNKSAGIVPGIRPGDRTTEYFESVLAKISVIGGCFAAILAVIPILVERFNSGLAGVSFGATSILIVIGVALDFSRRLQSQMIVRHYEGFLK